MTEQKKFGSKTILLITLGIVLLSTSIIVIVKKNNDFLSGKVKIEPQSNLSASLAADNPVGREIQPGEDNIDLMKIKLAASGKRAVVVKEIIFSTLPASTNASIKNLELYNTDTEQLLASNILSNGKVTFSTNYSVKANTVVGLTLKGDIEEDIKTGSIGFQLSDSSSIKAYGSKGKIPVEVIGEFPINGSIFTIAEPQNKPSIEVSKNSSYSDGSFVAGSPGIKIGSFIVAVDDQEDVKITSIGLSVDNSANLSTVLFNLRVTVQNSQIGTTINVVKDNELYKFPADWVIGKNTQSVFDIYIDSSSTFLGTVNVHIPTNGIYGTGTSSSESVFAPSEELILQTFETVSYSDPELLKINTSPTNPPSKELPAGTSISDPESEIYSFELLAQKLDSIYVKELKFRLDSPDDNVAVTELGLFNSSQTLIAKTPLASDGVNRGGIFIFSFSGEERLNIPLNSKQTFNLRIGINQSNQGPVVGKTPQIHLSSIKAEGPSFQITNPTISNGFNQTSTVLRAGADYAGCDLGSSINESETTLTFYNGENTMACAGAGIPAGTLITIDDEDMQVISNSGTEIKVLRGQNKTTQSPHASRAKMYYGGLGNASMSNIVTLEDASIIKIGQIVKIDDEHMEAFKIDTMYDLVYVVRGVNNSFINSHLQDAASIFSADALQSNIVTVVP